MDHEGLDAGGDDVVRDGNATQWTAGSSNTVRSWDGADRNTAVQTTGTDLAAVVYVRDATDQIIRRDATGDPTPSA
ncbi:MULTISPECIES: hypothetical protein [unclassified Nonomuraea]|uniref:hypothetical protein n=1 Tax=unclassified Nonomuraea TaxID=2593643 RepID=UPI00340A3403